MSFLLFHFFSSRLSQTRNETYIPSLSAVPALSHIMESLSMSTQIQHSILHVSFSAAVQHVNMSLEARPLSARSFLFFQILMISIVVVLFVLFV